MGFVQPGDWKNSDDISLSSECLICCHFQNMSQAKELALQYFKLSHHTEDPIESCLDIHLVSMFVLRKLLNYPNYECEKMLKNSYGESPGDWFVLCERCLKLARQAYRLQVQIEKLEKELKNIQHQAKYLIQKNSTKDSIRRGVREDIRAYFREDSQLVTTAVTVIKIEKVEEPFDSEINEDSSPPNNFIDSNSYINDPSGTEYSPKKTRVRRRKPSSNKVDSNNYSDGPIDADFPPKKTRTIRNKLSSTIVKAKRLVKKLPQKNRTNLTPSELKLLSNDPINRAKDIELLLQIRTYAGAHKTRPNCPICNKSIISTIRLREHMRLHLSTTNLFPCKICNSPSQTQLSLERHITQCHKPDLSSKSISELESSCKDRDELVKLLLRSFPSNVVRENDNPASCPLCNAKVTLIRSHLLLHSLKYQSFECKLCRHPSKGENGLTYHMLTFHKSQLPSMGLDHLKKTIRKDGPNRVKCNICGYTYSSRDRLNKHMKDHKMFGATTCRTCKFPCRSTRGLETHSKLKHSQVGLGEISQINSNPDCSNTSSAPESEQAAEELVQQKKTRGKDGPNRVQCDICGRTYSRRLFLNDEIVFPLFLLLIMMMIVTTEP